MSLESCNFKSNSSGNRGGGIHNSGFLNLESCIFDCNSSKEYRSGAIYSWKKYGSKNCTFKGNKPDDVYPK